MKHLLAVSFFALCTACSSTNERAATSDAGSAEKYKQHAGRTLPLEEKAFVIAIEKLDRQAILKDLGEPAQADDVKVKGTNKVVASIWHYHNINTDVDGKYFETTELDFVGDKLKQVVFLNNDGSEKPAEDGHAYELPENKKNH